LIDQIKALQNHPGFDFSFDTFVDFEDALVSYTENGIDTYQAFFSELQKAGIHRKWAIYTREDTTFQSANMSHLLMSNDIEVDVFQNKKMVLSFLGISEADLGANTLPRVTAHNPEYPAAGLNHRPCLRQGRPGERFDGARNAVPTV
jgi:hypothetical protein